MDKGLHVVITLGGSSLGESSTIEYLTSDPEKIKAKVRDASEKMLTLIDKSFKEAKKGGMVFRPDYSIHVYLTNYINYLDEEETR